MLSNPKAITVLFSLVLSVFYLRNVELSPARVLLEGMRILSTNIADEMCGDINPNDPFTDAEKERADGFLTSLEGLRGGNPLKDFLISGDDLSTGGKDYAMKLIPAAGVWIAFFVISIIGCCTCCCNWCCMYCLCKNCCKEKCKCCKQPKTKKCKNFYLIGALLFTLASVAASIAGIVISGGVSSGGQKTTCAAATFFQTFIDGDKPTKWIGLKPAVNAIGTVADKFDGIINTLTDPDTNYANIDAKYNIVTGDINTMYTTFQGKTARNPDPDASSGTYKPEVIKNLGPTSDKGTVTGSLTLEMKTKKDVVKTASTQMKSATDNLKGSAAPIKSAIQAGKQTADDIMKTIDDVLNKVADQGDTVNKVFDIIGVVLMIIFVVILVIGALALASILLVRLCKLRLFNKLTHLTWCLLGILMILGWILSSILFPVSIVLVESCGVIQSFLNDEKFYNKAMDTLAPGNDQIKKTISTCLYAKVGEKDMLENFGVRDQLNNFDTLFTQIDNAKKYFRPTGTGADSVAIPKWQDVVDKTGAYKIADSSITTDALAKLTGETTNSCATVDDTWVFHSSLCKSSMGTALLSSESVAAHRGSATCIGLDQWHSFGTSRYVSSNFPAACSGFTYTDVNTFANAWRGNRDDIDDIFTTGVNNLHDTLATIATDNTAFVNEVYHLTDPIKQIGDEIHDLYAVLADPEDGLFSNVQCDFVGVGLRMVSNAMCVGFISSIYQTSVVIIIVSMFAFFATFFVFCTAKRAIIHDDEEDHK